MNPLAAIYGAVVKARNSSFDRGTATIHRLQGPVISIGNIAVGGSGKTPFLITLGELLKSRGVRFDVLSRGYGRATKGVAQVDPNGSPRDFGDEPLLIARKLNVAVIVGEDRYAAGQFAEQKFGPQLHLLDDGFQHRGLARDFDIVLVTDSDARDWLLPTGRLREPLSSLSRANAVVLTNRTPVEGLPLAHQPVWRVERGILPPQTSERCLAFCGVARPENFFSQLRQSGLTLAGTRRFRDHHAYSDSDVRGLLVQKLKLGAEALVTTEKDAINLRNLLPRLGPVHVVPVQLQIEKADAVLDTLLAAIAGRNSSLRERI